MKTKEKSDKKFAKSFTHGWTKSQILLELIINKSHWKFQSPNSLISTVDGEICNQFVND